MRSPAVRRCLKAPPFSRACICSRPVPHVHATPDPFLLIFQDDQKGNHVQVYKSETIKVTLAPKWKACKPAFRRRAQRTLPERAR